MSETKTWEISKLSCKSNLADSAKVILQNRTDGLMNSIMNYLDKTSEDNLHEIRISIRRLRYPMEVFIKCFNRKKYLSFYKSLSKLQDKSGDVRDLDIFKKNLVTFQKQNNSHLKKINFDAIDSHKNELQANLKLDLMKFIHGKELKAFKKMINSHN